MSPLELAKAWLLAHGYAQFKDGTWGADGGEVNVADVLAEYIEEQQS